MPKMYFFYLKRYAKNVNVLNLFCFRSVSFFLPFSTLSPISSSQDTRENQVSRHTVVNALPLMPCGLDMFRGRTARVSMVSVLIVPGVEAGGCLMLRALKITYRESDYLQGQ